VIAECANTVECTANFTSIGAIDACIESNWPTATTAGAEQACEAERRKGTPIRSGKRAYGSNETQNSAAYAVLRISCGIH
jgi:hypothetical protein